MNLTVKELKVGMDLQERSGGPTMKIFEIDSRPTCGRTNVHVRTEHAKGNIACYYRDAPIRIKDESVKQ